MEKQKMDQQMRKKHGNLFSQISTNVDMSHPNTAKTTSMSNYAVMARFGGSIDAYEMERRRRRYLQAKVIEE